MAARYLTDLADVLRKAGLTVVEIPGWRTRGRPGSFDPKGVLAHHTGGPGDGLAYAKWMAKDGRADLKAPLAQLGLDRKGVWYVQAAGRANHAGQCKPIRGLTALRGRTYGDGNEQLVGVEAMNTGSEGWPPAQYGSYVAGVAALTKHYGWSIVLGHKETSLSGKVDPGRIDMDDFRRDVAAARKHPPAQEDPMADITEDTVRDIFTRHPVMVDPVTGKRVTPSNVIETAARNSLAAVAEVRALAAVVAKIAAAGTGLTVQQITDAARAGADAALDERIADAKVVLEVQP